MGHSPHKMPPGMSLQGISYSSSTRLQATHGPGSLSVWVTCGMKVAPETGFLHPIPNLAVSCCIIHGSSCVLAPQLIARILQAGCRANLLSAKGFQGKTAYHAAHPIVVRLLFQPNQQHLKGSPCRSGISARYPRYLGPGLLPRDFAGMVSSASNIKDNPVHDRLQHP